MDHPLGNDQVMMTNRNRFELELVSGGSWECSNWEFRSIVKTKWELPGRRCSIYLLASDKNFHELLTGKLSKKEFPVMSEFDFEASSEGSWVIEPFQGDGQSIVPEIKNNHGLKI